MSKPAYLFDKFLESFPQNQEGEKNNILCPWMLEKYFNASQYPLSYFVTYMRRDIGNCHVYG